ncbi:hypothetical protein QVD17_30549 [Tagetes erecta]|uniref:Uncharacterized protein n=1 Tax=Tagetes erecta TaxID=13708 RepID=A0AAD8K848_TARER|nr:hypothetical protein QVD17_30549 [Tagetes erecta]
MNEERDEFQQKQRELQRMINSLNSELKKDQLKEEITKNETFRKESKAYDDEINSLSKNVVIEVKLEEFKVSEKNLTKELNKTKSELDMVEAYEECKLPRRNV